MNLCCIVLVLRLFLTIFTLSLQSATVQVALDAWHGSWWKYKYPSVLYIFMTGNQSGPKISKNISATQRHQASQSVTLRHRTLHCVTERHMSLYVDFNKKYFPKEIFFQKIRKNLEKNFSHRTLLAELLITNKKMMKKLRN